MWVYCGLGNPGPQYERTRHNFGFIVITAFAMKHKLNFRYEAFFESEIASYDNKALLIKPQTYMNLSGRAVKKVLTYYKLTPQNLLVIYDDMDLPLGKIKLLPKGGAGGHKGVLSIIEYLQNKDFPRMKLGIGRPEKENPKNYVLSEFNREEWKIVEKVMEKALWALDNILYDDFTKTMSQINSWRVLENE